MKAHDPKEREREAKLPVWAQARLDSLRRNLEAQRKHIAEMKDANPDTNTRLLDYSQGDTPLPADARVGFNPKPNAMAGRNQIQVYIEKGRLRVQGDYPLTIRPEASNTFTVELREHH